MSYSSDNDEGEYAALYDHSNKHLDDKAIEVNSFNDGCHDESSSDESASMPTSRWAIDQILSSKESDGQASSKTSTKAVLNYNKVMIMILFETGIELFAG
jgi:hypothetical protein